MTIAWRLCRRPHADLSGEGARRFGGRWNRRGRPVVYLAEHPALAALEVRVHLDLPLELLPDDYVLVQVRLPDRPIGRIDAVSVNTEEAGDAWLRAGETAVLIVPSVLMPHSWNLLLNPEHSAGADARAITVEPFRFDPRLWRPS